VNGRKQPVSDEHNMKLNGKSEQNEKRPWHKASDESTVPIYSRQLKGYIDFSL
jgi:hypothetical protein